VQRVLVAFGSTNGSTAEIARAVGELLRGRGFAVDVVAAAEVGDVREYDAVILGGAI
jgi:menaquinone-dependent protoporphyrinogen oxidase